MAVKTVSSREARAKWRDLLDKLLTRTADVVIELNKQSVAVLISIDDHEELQEELDNLALRAGLVKSMKGGNAILPPPGPLKTLKPS